MKIYKFMKKEKIRPVFRYVWTRRKTNGNREGAAVLADKYFHNEGEFSTIL
jgi:hypothetical protein